MKKNMAYCGILCEDCPAYQATKNDDNAERERIAREWSTDEYTLSAEDINCEGCTSDDENVISFVEDCDVRKCAEEKTIPNCAHCKEYPCKRFDRKVEAIGFMEAMTRLNEIRKKLRRL